MKTSNKDNFCVILAGGKGRRLWPCSREKKPKQFVDFFSTGRTLLQATFDRMSKIIPLENIYISTNHEYAHFVLDQLPELPRENVLSEPIHRNTAPSVAWATYRIQRRNPNARMVVVPSDQTVFKEDVFVKEIKKGLTLVSQHEQILALGVTPTRPEPGYGYIQLGEQVSEENVYKVKSFTEKPDRSFAQMFMDSGEFVWNTGLYISNVHHMLDCMHRMFPEMLHKVDLHVSGAATLDDELLYIEENFPAYPNMSIDYGLLDQHEDARVMRCDFGWADLGMWHSVYESLQKSPGDNVIISSNVMIEDSRDNIVKLPADHMCVINGLEGFIVAEEGNVLLICKKEDSSALIRKYVSEMAIKHGDEYI